jgi:restriction endonuclease
MTTLNGLLHETRHFRIKREFDVIARAKPVSITDQPENAQKKRDTQAMNEDSLQLWIADARLFGHWIAKFYFEPSSTS